VADLLQKLWAGGQAAYVVGGSLRDALLGREPADWDLTTDARPERVQALFPGSLYENRYGTVVVRHGGDQYEITAFRRDAGVLTGVGLAGSGLIAERLYSHPAITVIGIDDIYCKDVAEPCNDRLPDGTFARPDGSHFSKAYMPVVAKVLAQRIAAAVR